MADRVLRALKHAHAIGDLERYEVDGRTRRLIDMLAGMSNREAAGALALALESAYCDGYITHRQERRAARQLKRH